MTGNPAAQAFPFAAPLPAHVHEHASRDAATHPDKSAWGPVVVFPDCRDREGYEREKDARVSRPPRADPPDEREVGAEGEDRSKDSQVGQRKGIGLAPADVKGLAE